MCNVIIYSQVLERIVINYPVMYPEWLMLGYVSRGTFIIVML